MRSDGEGPAAGVRVCLCPLSVSFLDSVSAQLDHTPRLITDLAHVVPFMTWPPPLSVCVSCPYSSSVQQLVCVECPCGMCHSDHSSLAVCAHGRAWRCMAVRPSAAQEMLDLFLWGQRRLRG